MNTQNPKMNRLIPTVSILLILAMTIFLMTSCGQEKKGNNHAANGTTGVADLLQSAENASNPTTDTKPSTIATVPSETPSTESLPEEPETSKSKDGIDVDLSQMSATTVYAEVLGMVYEPERYKGKTVKMKGNPSERATRTLISGSSIKYILENPWESFQKNSSIPVILTKASSSYESIV